MAVFLYLLSWFAAGFHIILGTLALASALYYLAEMVEEYVSYASKIIRIAIITTIGLYILLMLFEDFPTSVLCCGFASQLIYLSIMNTFPFFQFTSPPFVIGCILFVLNHYLTFSYFTTTFHPIYEVLSYFTIFIWLVPFGFFISLSANENILPTRAETTPLLSGNKEDFVTGYFNKKGKRYSLLSLFSYLKEGFFPARAKKLF